MGHERLRKKILEGHGFGHYLLDCMEAEEMSIQRLCRLASSPPHLRFNSNTFYSLVYGKNRTVTDLDLVFLATLLHTSPARMVAMYMADKKRFGDLDQEEQQRVALQESFLLILNVLPTGELEEFEALARAKAERYRDKINEERARLHGSREVGFAKGKK